MCAMVRNQYICSVSKQYLAYYLNKNSFPHKNISFLFRFVQDSRSGATTAGRGQSHAARRKGLKETIMAPSTGGAFSIGQGALAGA